MVRVEQEKNVEVLRQYALMLQTALKTANKEIAKLKSLGIVDTQSWLDGALQDQLSRLQKKFYGGGREELPVDRPVGKPQEELKIHGDRAQEVPEPKARENRLTHDPIFCRYLLSDEELRRENIIRGIGAGPEAWEEIPGLYQESKTVSVREIAYVHEIHQQTKYRLKKAFNRTDKEIIITAPGPVKLRAYSRYSLDFALSVVSDKYEYHLPLERQRRRMEAAGLDVDVKTLYGLCEAVAEHCDGIRERIRQDIQKDFCATHIDETTWPVQGNESQSYMWAISNRIGSYYQFEPSRSGKIAEEMLKDYEGSILTDGFSGYNRVKRNSKIRVGHCWAHARREFYERLDDFPTEATAAVTLIDTIFAIEAKAKTIEELARLRKSESKDVIQEFYQWMLKTRGKFLESQGITAAINYCLKFWKELTLFVEDASVPLSNNDAERALRHVVMGRKNFNGSKTINGADTAASLYTVIESCKKVGLQPSQYLKYLIEHRWRGLPVKTPFERSMEILGPNKKTKFPPKSEWRT